MSKKRFKHLQQALKQRIVGVEKKQDGSIRYKIADLRKGQ